MFEQEENRIIRSENMAASADSSDSYLNLAANKGQDLLKAFENTISQMSSPESAFGHMPLPLELNEIIADKYKILEVASSGSMGVVYKAEDLMLSRTVAIKILLPDKPLDPVAKRRFEREARIVASLSHPNIVAVYDSGFLKNDMLYLVMEYLAGQTLADILKTSQRLDFNLAIPMFMQVCAALEHAHDNNVIHRDLKPSNIMVMTDHKSNKLAKVIDFSIAKFTKPKPDQKTLTRPGDIFGSPLYMSPEQCQAKALDHRSDIYSLGCVMYEVLSGMPPLMGESAMATIYMHVHSWPTPISKLTTNLPIPAYLETIVLTALEKEPKERFQSMEELLGQLKYFYEQEKKKAASPDWLKQVGQLFSR